MWISKQEYDESGPSIVHRKCGDAILAWFPLKYGTHFCLLVFDFDSNRLLRVCAASPRVLVATGCPSSNQKQNKNQSINQQQFEFVGFLFLSRDFKGVS